MSFAEETPAAGASEARTGSERLADPPPPGAPSSRHASPVQTPGGSILFGTQRPSRTNSPYAPPRGLPAGDALKKEHRAHTATPGSPSMRAQTLKFASTRVSGVGQSSEGAVGDPRTPVQPVPTTVEPIDTVYIVTDSEDSAGEYSETTGTSARVRIRVKTDAEVEEEHKARMLEEQRNHEDGMADAQAKLELEYMQSERALNDEIKKATEKLKNKHAQRSQELNDYFTAESERIQAGTEMSAAQIRAQRKEAKRKRRKEREERGHYLSTPGERGEARLPHTSESADETDTNIITGTTNTKKRSRVSLGTSATAMMSLLPSTPAKGKGKESAKQQIPSGGYLANAFKPRTASNQPADSGDPAHTPGRASTSKAVSFDAARWPYRPTSNTASSSTPLKIASGGKLGGGDSEGSSSSDSDYKRMSQPERRAYKKVKKETRDKMRQSVEEKEREKRQREKIEKLKLSGYKTKLPTAYDGAADFDVYEQWLFKMHTWIRDTGFDEEEAVVHTKAFLKGKAGTFYMNNVAPRPEIYDFQRLTVELFAYCFPPDINARLRRKFMSLKQTDRGFKDFRLSNITDIQVAQRMWEGSHSYLRIEWAKAGYSAEENTVDELEESGIRFEMAEKIRRNEEDRRKSRDNKDNKQYWSNRSAYKDESSTKSNKISYSKDSRSSRPPHNPRNRERRDGKDRRDNRQGPRLTKEQVDQYRAAGKCFLCSEVGHTVKDCPKRNQAKPSTLSSSAVRFAHIEELDDKRRGLEVNHIDIDTESDFGDEEDNDEEEKTLDELIEEQIDTYIELCATKMKKKQERGEIERNSVMPKDFERKVANAIIVEMFINGKSCCVLLDTGSVGDVISSTTVDQLKIKTEILAKPIGLAMAVAGSRGVIKHSATVNIKYQNIDNTYRLDVANLDRYDLILGTTFMYRHSIMLGFNPESVLVRSAKLLPLNGPTICTISSNATELYEAELDKIREELRKESEDICKKASETPLPPLRVINHRIPLIDENKTYSWQSSRCPEALRNQWEIKMKAYLDTGRWEFATGVNAIPMLLITKKGVEGESTLRTVLDKREQNANTYKMSSPLPDIQEILWKVSKYPYRSLIDGKDAYKQIRVEPEDVPKTLFTTPSGTMTSKVMQIGDCNATATYQSLMNHIFAHAIGVYMHVFLDDIVVYTNTLEEHIQRVKEVFEVLRKQKVFLSPEKMQFLVEELHILSHIVDSRGIQMDPHKVESVVNWKVPNTKDQLLSFIGAVGYLAPNCDGIRIPMGILTARASLHKHWNWDATAQRAFEETKQIVNKWRDHHRTAIDYSEGAPPINLVTDASLTGASGVLSQGEDIKTAKIAMFWSGKFTPTQQNYPVHELELYAIKELFENFQYQLHGVKFCIYTDNKSLINILTQKNLSGRQARWLEVINQFNFEIIHIPGEENEVADALSRIYADEPEGMVQALSEYVPEDEDLIERMESAHIRWDEREGTTIPLLVANAAIAPESPGSPGSPELETRPENISKEASEGASEQGPEEEASSEVNKQTLRRSGRERFPVIKYAAPAKAPKQKKKWSATKAPKQVTEGASSGSTPQTKQLAESENKEANMTHQSGVSKEKEDQGAHIVNKEIEKKTLVYHDASPTLLDQIGDTYQSDTLMSKVYENPSHYNNFEIIDGIMYIKEKRGLAVCVPKDSAKGENLRELVIRESHELLKHAGSRKTLYAMRGRVWWESMVADVKQYCQSCNVCATAKSSTQSKIGLLVPLKRPETPWEQISIDFVGPLPESENLLGKWDMILVAVDHATNMIRIIPTKQTYKSKDVAEIMYENVYKIHGIPRVIISDRDSLFTATFWSESNRLMGIQTRMSSAYHPETDGATERANKTIGSMIRQCIKGKQNDWVKYLPGIEYAMNASVLDTTGYSPFYLNYGRVPPAMVWQTESQFTGVRRYLVRQREALIRAHDAIIGSRVKQTEQANKHRRAADFKVGDLVYLSSKNMRLPPRFSRKLTPKFIGPHRIVQEVTKGTTYKVDLPSALSARGIHPVFHASLLRPHIPNDDRKFPGRSEEQIIVLDKEPEEWAVDRILTHAGKGRDAEFKLLWKSGDYSWEKHEHIRHLEAMDTYLEAQGVEDAAQLPWTDHREEIASDGEEQVKGEGEPLLEANRIEVREITAHICTPRDNERVLKASKTTLRTISSSPTCSTHNTFYAYILLFLSTMYTLNPRHNVSLTREQLEQCLNYRDALNDHRLGHGEHPGVEPRAYQLYRAVMLANAGSDHQVPTGSFTQRRTRFTATEDGNIVDLSSALQALMDTRDELRNVIQRVGSTGSPRRPLLQAKYPPIPDGFTGQITTSLASRIGADDSILVKITQRINRMYLQERQLLRSGSLGTALQMASLPARPRSTGTAASRGGKKLPGTATLQAETVDRPRTESGPEPIEIDGPGEISPLGETSPNAGSSTLVAQTDADPSLDSEDDGWTIPDYDDGSWTLATDASGLFSEPSSVLKLDSDRFAFSSTQTLKDTDKWTPKRSWLIVGGGGAVSRDHVDSAGKATYVKVEAGAGKLWLICLGRRDGADRITNSDPWPAERWAYTTADNTSWVKDYHWQAIYLPKGSILIMRPYTIHIVLTPGPTLCLGGHFYSAPTMTATMHAKRYEHVHPLGLSNETHVGSWVGIHRMLIYAWWKVQACKSSPPYTTDCLAALVLMCQQPQYFTNMKETFPPDIDGYETQEKKARVASSELRKKSLPELDAAVVVLEECLKEWVGKLYTWWDGKAESYMIDVFEDSDGDEELEPESEDD
ncbi:hypothetical protein FRC09_008934 [Ceratobasidium sp. 395]|nr:hypothetical protein FRC09_008934 [Ceratobasidium sp. 395]